MKELEDLNYKEVKQFEKERLFNRFRKELHTNNLVEVAIVREFLQLEKDERK